MKYFESAFDPEAICPRAGLGEFDGDPLVTPLVQSTTFCRNGVESTSPHQYSRVSNPTVLALETTLGRLEDSPPAVCFTSGLAAETALVLSVVKAGEHVICGQSVYGGTTRLLTDVFDGFGVEYTFVDATSNHAIREAVRPNTKLIFVETPANPTLELTDIAAAATIAHEAGALLAVDNTFMTPILQQPQELGADITVYSTTKFIDGHSVALGGALVTRNESLLERFRFIRKSTGSIQTPFNAWLTLNSIKTLPLRIRRQSETAREVALWLSNHPDIARVNYPSPDITTQADLAEFQHIGYHGAVLSFEPCGGFDAARNLAQATRLCRLVEHVGSSDTLLTHPASMTHVDVPREKREAVGVTDGLLRLSVGLEPTEAILADLDQAIAAGTGVHTYSKRKRA